MSAASDRTPSSIQGTANCLDNSCTPVIRSVVNSPLCHNLSLPTYSSRPNQSQTVQKSSFGICSIPGNLQSRPPATPLFAIACCDDRVVPQPRPVFHVHTLRTPASVTPLLAILTDEYRVLTEIGRDHRALTPLFPILTRSRVRKSFVCHTYKKRPGGWVTQVVRRRAFHFGTLGMFGLRRATHRAPKDHSPLLSPPERLSPSASFWHFILCTFYLIRAAMVRSASSAAPALPRTAASLPAAPASSPHLSPGRA